jgi:hypothetical protein
VEVSFGATRPVESSRERVEATHRVERPNGRGLQAGTAIDQAIGQKPNRALLDVRAIAFLDRRGEYSVEASVRVYAKERQCDLVVLVPTLANAKSKRGFTEGGTSFENYDLIRRPFALISRGARDEVLLGVIHGDSVDKCRSYRLLSGRWRDVGDELVLDSGTDSAASR